MKVGDLITSIGFGTRIGFVEEIWTAGSSCWMVTVVWSDGETANYYSHQLEVL